MASVNCHGFLCVKRAELTLFPVSCISFLGTSTPVQGRVARTRRQRGQYTSVYTVASMCKRVHGLYMTLKAFIATFAHLHKISRVWIDRVPVDVKRCPMTTLRSRRDREQFLETGNGLLRRRRNDSDHAKC